MKPKGEEEARSSAREDAETSGGVGGVDQSVGYIVQFFQHGQVVSEEKKIVSDVVVLAIS